MEQDNEPKGMTRRRARIRALLEQQPRNDSSKPKRQQQAETVKRLLLSRPRSLAELRFNGIDDPGEVIARLKRRGYKIISLWRKHIDGSRYKIYYLSSKQPQQQKQ